MVDHVQDLAHSGGAWRGIWEVSQAEGMLLLVQGGNCRHGEVWVALITYQIWGWC